MINNDTYSGPSFSFTNRLARFCWNVAYIIFFRPSPVILFGWRNMLLRIFGAQVGKGVHVYPRVKIWAPWNLRLGNQCSVANDAILYSMEVIDIGRKGIISQGTFLCTGSHDYTRWGHPVITAPILIGEQAWLAAEVFVHPGTTIGEGCVIGARSVVIKNMPAWMVCAGNPCVPVKERVMEEDVQPAKLKNIS